MRNAREGVQGASCTSWALSTWHWGSLTWFLARMYQLLCADVLSPGRHQSVRFLVVFENGTEAAQGSRLGQVGMGRRGV